ncbi:transmembrane protein 131 homolog [Stomoxys calcitrans]|uniref:transmembrane protein 131 homolog n=1 Tax=Stomoxys calcitrans TaxID=35570 RepID=UPI0027E2430A|nr:transmembrane protein 131 homolog [Stomoxys calcitrans]
MFSYHRLWLSMLVLAFLTTTMCGFANNDMEILESTTADLKHDGHHLDTQATANLKDITDAGGGGEPEGGGGIASDLDMERLDRLRFEPSHLDFGVWSVGTVQSHTVTLINQNRNHSVYLGSVYVGKTPAFYSSLFEAKTVPPNGNTTFNVVFLPREQGAVSTSLHIHTSFGKLLLMVRGEGRECPYRLKPLVGIRAPLNATLMPMIHMYNPHEKTLQILEIYSSGGQFQLELPSGDPEAPQGLWQIPPYSTKPIIRIRFQGYLAGNYSAYIRIKISEPMDNKHPQESKDDDEDYEEEVDQSSATTPPHRKEQVLVIPVEFEILPDYGLYAENPVLEFGYIAIGEGATATKPIEQKLSLRHSKGHLEADNLKFESITPISGVTLKPTADIETLTIYPEDIINPVTILNEKLKLVLKDTTTMSSSAAAATAAAFTYHNVELIIRAHIFKGSLHYDANSTVFLDHKINSSIDDQSMGDQAAQEEPIKNGEEHESMLGEHKEGVDEDSGKQRHIVLRNDFQVPLVVYNVTTTTQNDSLSKLSLQLIHQPLEKDNQQLGQLVLQPGLTLDLLVAFRLAKRKQQQKQEDKGEEEQQEDLKDLTRNYKTAIYVYTNITNFEIPIVISSTRLFVTTQTQSIWRSNNSVYTKELQLSSVPLREISQQGYVILQNPNAIPIQLSDWNIEKAPGIYFSATFVGFIRAAAINKSNDYSVDLEKFDYKLDSGIEASGGAAVFSIRLQPYTSELRTTYLRIATPYENLTIAVKFSIALGKLEVDQEKLHFANCFPGKICSSELSIRSTFKQAIQMKYINFTDPGLSFEDKNSHGSKLAANSVTTVGRIFFEPSALCETRCYIPEYTDESSVFPSTHSNAINSINMPHFDELELRRRTELYRQFKYYFQNLDFTMTTKAMQHFQLNLMIEIQWPKLVTSRQVLPTIEVNKTQVFEVKISNPSDRPILIDYLLADPRLAKQTQISLPLEVIILTPSCYLTDKPVFSMVTPAPKKPILIPGLTSIKVPIQFKASSLGNYCTLLHIRNNLTLYEGIWISAKAVQSQFRLGNRKPGSPTPLLFDISEQQISAACSTKEESFEKQTTHPQVFSRRVFTARNSGELPIWVDSFWIGDQPCMGYGFQIMNCSSFELKANSSKVIEILFQTDFTVTRMEKTLTLKTNLTYAVTYMLVAQLPSKGMEKCTPLLPRPPWEEKIRNATIVMLMITFVLVVIAVHIDYGNIMYTQATIYGAREKSRIHPTFNLRNIAMRSTNQNFNEFAEAEGIEMAQRNKTGLRKRNSGSKSQKASNGESSPPTSSMPSSFAALPNLTLAEMVSWTFGNKTTKKSSKTNKAKEFTNNTTTSTITAPATATSASYNGSNATSFEAKVPKSKCNEKLLIDKMDDDVKKVLPNKKPVKIVEKSFAAIKISGEEQNKTNKDEVVLTATEKELKREKSHLTKTPSPKAQEVLPVAKEQHRKQFETPCETGSNTSQVELLLSSSPHVTPPPALNQQTNSKSNTLSLLITPMAEITNQQIPHKEALAANGRKLGKTPGRERRKQSAQNTSPATSSCSSASTSSSLGSLTQQPVASTSKRYERKTKNKAMNSLKFSPLNSHATNSSLYVSHASMAAAANGHNDQTFNSDSLWDYNSQITFSDVLQQTQQFANSQAAALNASPSTLLNTDLMQHSSSLFDGSANVGPRSSPSTPPGLMQQNVVQFGKNLGMENSEITAALTPKRPIKPTASDLGPIGSKKSPSSTPPWETTNSAIPMPLPRPLNTTITSTSVPPLPYDLQTHNFGFNDLLTARQTIQQIASANSQQNQHQHQQQQQQQTQQAQQHEFDIAAKLRAIKAHEIMMVQLEQHLMLQQQQQQQQQYLNAINNNWPTANATPWTPFVNSNGNNLAACSNADIFVGGPSVSTPSATWRSTPAAMDSHYAVIQHLPLTPDAVAPGVSISSSSGISSTATATSLAMNGGDSIPNTVAAASSSSCTSNVNTVADNMPLFNLFGRDLSCLWDENWKKPSTQQQQSQKPNSKQD